MKIVTALKTCWSWLQHQWERRLRLPTAILLLVLFFVLLGTMWWCEWNCSERCGEDAAHAYQPFVGCQCRYYAGDWTVLP